MTVLFITRKYPPQIGGMETYSYNLIKYFPGSKKVIALGRSQKHLFWFLPYACLKGWLMSFRVDSIHLCDSLLSPVGFILKIITRKPVTASAHGLDIVYPNLFYQRFNIPLLRRLDHIIAVSSETRTQCLHRGIAEHKLTVIPNGVDATLFSRQVSHTEARERIRDTYAFLEAEDKILLTVGRLTERKGVQWFVQHIIPKLPPHFKYLVVGAGPEEKHIKDFIESQHLGHRVFLLGRVPDDAMQLLYAGSDIFLMPNIKVRGDQEGFGLVALEAAASGLPVIASDLEGIRDGIQNEKNGYLVPTRDEAAFINRINKITRLTDEEFMGLRNRFQDYTRKTYDWPIIIDQYFAIFHKLISS